MVSCFKVPTRIEPIGGRVGVEGLKAYHLVELGPFAHSYADERILMLWNHQHLKHLQRTRQGEVYALRGIRRWLTWNSVHVKMPSKAILITSLK